METATLLYTKIIYNVVMTSGKAPHPKNRGKDVNQGKFYQSGRDKLRLRKSWTDIFKTIPLIANIE
jgi:hypothetical protein